MKKVLLTTLLAVAPVAIAQDTLQEWTVFPTFASNNDRFQDIRQPWAMCSTCHGAMGQGGIGPALAGQSADDIISKLLHYKMGHKDGPQAAMMIPWAQSLEDAKLDSLEYLFKKDFQHNEQ